MSVPLSIRVPALLLKLRDKSRNRHSIFHMAAIVLKTNACVQILFALSSIVLIRYLAKADYGLWRVLASTTAFIPLLFGGFDQAIYRFVPVESRRNGDAVVLSAFSAKLGVTLIALGALVVLYPRLPVLLNLPPAALPLFRPLFWLLIASTALTPVSTTLFAVAGSHKQFDLVFRLSVTKQALMAGAVLAVVGLGLTLAHYAACELVLSIVQAAILWRIGRPRALEKGGDLWGGLTQRGRWGLLRDGWKTYLRGYAVPLNVASALSYIRGHVPVILLGSRFSLESAAVYSILKNLLTTIHKTEGGIVGGVLPRVFELYETNRAGFIPKFRRWTTLISAARAGVGLAIVAGSPLLFWLYKIEPSPYLTVVLAILVLEFVMGEVVNISNIVVMLSRRTTMLMLSAGVRFVFEILLLIFVTRRFGMFGAAVTLFLARSIETFSTMRAAERIVPLPQQRIVYASLVGAFVVITGGALWLGAPVFLHVHPSR